MPSHDDLKQALSHVLWIGGAPDAGKTSVAQILAEKHQLQLYSFDQWEAGHFGRLIPDQHPAMDAVSPMTMTMDQRWVLRPPQMMAQQTIAAWTERFGMTIEDLLAMPQAPMILAEGPGLFPECVYPLLSNPRQGIWLVPTETFKWVSATQRNKLSAWGETSDPDRAQHNWFTRDMLLAAHVKQRTEELQLTLYEVDRTRSLRAMATLVEQHFEPLLLKSHDKE